MGPQIGSAGEFGEADGVVEQCFGGAVVASVLV
jgi:hypothetical protein